jgi:hypothetical protein
MQMHMNAVHQCTLHSSHSARLHVTWCTVTSVRQLDSYTVTRCQLHSYTCTVTQWTETQCTVTQLQYCFAVHLISQCQIHAVTACFTVTSFCSSRSFGSSQLPDTQLPDCTSYCYPVTAVAQLQLRSCTLHQLRSCALPPVAQMHSYGLRSHLIPQLHGCAVLHSFAVTRLCAIAQGRCCTGYDSYSSYYS